MENQNNLKQRGVSLIITFFIMIIILAVVISISILLYSGIKVIRNMGNSVVAFYAADSGVEKVLYYDRQVKPLLADGKTQVARGLCAMIDTEYPNYCQSDSDPDGQGNHSIYCNDPGFTIGSDNGCNYDICDNCTIDFDTNYYGKTYDVEAGVDKVNNYLIIKSRGVFNGVERRIETSVPLSGSEAPPPGGGGASCKTGGTPINGLCWYLGDPGQNCDDVCGGDRGGPKGGDCCATEYVEDPGCAVLNALTNNACLSTRCLPESPIFYAEEFCSDGSGFDHDSCGCNVQYPEARRVCVCVN